MVLCLAAAGMAACGKVYENLERDRTTIETFLTEKLGETATYEAVGGVYKYVQNSGREGYSTAAVAEKGDVVDFYYEAYAFARTLNLDVGNYNPTLIFATNRPETLDYLCNPAPEAIGAVAWDRTFWSDEPVAATIGDAALVEGVARGLAGLREGDQAWLLFTSDLGFGENKLGIVGINQILAYRIYIDKVTKRQSKI